MNFISQEVTKFNNWVGTLDAVPTIVEIRKKSRKYSHARDRKNFKENFLSLRRRQDNYFAK